MSAIVLTIIGFHFVFAGIVSLTLNTIEVPPHKVVGDKAVLICQFDMEGDTLYSVKWYKDDREFYRFVPNDRPRLQVFDTEGIQVDVSTKYDGYMIFITNGLKSVGTQKEVCFVFEASSCSTILNFQFR